MSKANKTIQDKITELNEQIAWFESDDFTVEAALEKFKAAEILAEEIEKDLTAAKNEINLIKQKFSESV